MPGRIARGACCAVFVLFLLPAAASAAFGDRPLRAGMAGEDVRVLQALLAKAGFRTTVDGQFGRMTRRAVGRWESDRERTVNGWMSRRDSLVLRGEFKAPIDAPAPAPTPEVEAPEAAGLMFLGARRKPGVTAEVASPGTVSAEVADAAGRIVRTIERRAREAGQVRLRWNGRLGRRPAPEGTYLVRLGDGSLIAGASASASDEPEAFELRHHVFPIKGRHDLGQSESNGFGGGRGHQGQDMFARCGTPVRAAQGGTVRFAGYHSAAGNYVVIRGTGSGEDYVYMHLRDAAEPAVGDKVATAERIGAVGATGRASGCHLHFELWSAPGWYRGGSAYDPLPKLRTWDGWS